LFGVRLSFSLFPKNFRLSLAERYKITSKKEKWGQMAFQTVFKRYEMNYSLKLEQKKRILYAILA